MPHETRGQDTEGIINRQGSTNTDEPKFKNLVIIDNKMHGLLQYGF